MKTNKIFHTGIMVSNLCCALLLTVALFSCSDSNDDNNNGSEQAETVTYDDLSYFQNCIIEVDDTGDIQMQHYGEVLYPDDPEHLYIGVDNYEEAEDLFREWMAPDVTLGTTAPLTACLTDSLGKAQGTVTFAKGTESGHVAEVTASAETQLQKFRKITFLLNSAWPFNSSSPVHAVGQIVKISLAHLDDDYYGLMEDDKNLDWVCIREEKNGQKPIFVTITKNSYKNGFGTTAQGTYGGAAKISKFDNLRDTYYCPGLENAKIISNILKEDWNSFCAYFEEANCGNLSQDAFWIDYSHGFFLFPFNDIMLMSSGRTIGVDGDRKAPFIFKVDWKSDYEVCRMVTPIAATDINIPGFKEKSYNLFDNDFSTKWYVQDPVKEDGIWYVEFRSQMATIITGYTLQTAKDTEKYPQRNPVAWKLKGKTYEKDEWKVLDERDTDKNPSDALPSSNKAGKTYTFENDKPYQYFRLEISRSHGTDMQLSGFAIN